eukprot:scaffold633_cov134-Isochrysis_galbana.AAC.7
MRTRGAARGGRGPRLARSRSGRWRAGRGREEVCFFLNKRVKRVKRKASFAPSERLPHDRPDSDPNPDSHRPLKDTGATRTSVLVCSLRLPRRHAPVRSFSPRCDSFVSVSPARDRDLSRSPLFRLASCPTLARSSPVFSTLFRTLILVPRWRSRLWVGVQLHPAFVASIHGLPRLVHTFRLSVVRPRDLCSARECGLLMTPGGSRCGLRIATGLR